MTTLHALPTDMTLHCYKGVMQTNIVPLVYTLTDYNGDEITDYNGDTQLSDGVDTALPVLHASKTNMNLHAE